jgi:hypothetical protein
VDFNKLAYCLLSFSRSQGTFNRTPIENPHMALLPNPKHWLAKFLLTNARQTEPDGRPLYAYKMRDATYAELKIHFHQILLLDSRGKLALRFAPIFCLYAAETFRREHAEGPWAWDTVFKPLGQEPPLQSLMADWVEQGLKWWQRPPVLRNAGGNRLFLVTIACEGGLPLRLLQRGKRSSGPILSHRAGSLLSQWSGRGGCREIIRPAAGSLFATQLAP